MRLALGQALDQEQAPSRPPLFEGAGKAAQRLRALPDYRAARFLLVMSDPALLQVRVNALNDRKNLVAATPGLKAGLVRLDAGQIPLPQRSRALRGGSISQAGRVLHFPHARLERVDLLVATALAADRQGNLLGDGRGLCDLVAALLARLKALGPSFKLVVLLDDSQLVENVPADPWDQRAGLIITPTQVIRPEGVKLPRPNLAGLPEKLASLPLVRGIAGGKP